MRRELTRAVAGVGAGLAVAARRSARRRTWVPLAAYYGITIAVPLANGSGSSERAFLEHMAFVAVFPLTLVGLFAVLCHAWRGRTRSNRRGVGKSALRSSSSSL
jgi:succinate dehydrogenase hydrophobic anchor subunit